jgi:hypothetical protein
MRFRISGSTSASAALCCAVALAAGATGCGSKSAQPDSQLDCLRDSEDAAATPVVARLYASGKLGSPVQFKARYFANVHRSAYLDAGGRLRPWNRLEERAQNDLRNLIHLHLITSPRYGQSIEAAYRRARQHLQCG